MNNELPSILAHPERYERIEILSREAPTAYKVETFGGPLTMQRQGEITSRFTVRRKARQTE